MSTPACRIGRTQPVCRKSDAYALSLARTLKPERVLLVQRRPNEARDWEALAAALLAGGAGEVVMVGPLPQWRRPLPELVALFHWPNVKPRIPAELESWTFAADSRLARRYAHGRTIRYLSLIQRLCTPQGCTALVPGHRRPALLQFDSNHLSPEGAAYVARTIIVPAVLSSRNALPSR